MVNGFSTGRCPYECLQAGKGAYILLVSSIFLVTEIVPVAMTVLFCMFLIPMIGVQTMAEVSQAFTNVGSTMYRTMCCIGETFSRRSKGRALLVQRRKEDICLS